MKLYNVLTFIWGFQKRRNKAKSIKADPEKQPKSKIFGITSIFVSILSVALSFLIVYGLKWMFADGLLIIIAGVAVGLIGLFGTLFSLYEAIESWAFQLYINKRTITWISLAVWILAIAAIVVILVMLL